MRTLNRSRYSVTIFGSRYSGLCCWVSGDCSSILDDGIINGLGWQHRAECYNCLGGLQEYGIVACKTRVLREPWEVSGIGTSVSKQAACRFTCGRNGPLLLPCDAQVYVQPCTTGDAPPPLKSLERAYIHTIRHEPKINPFAHNPDDL
jgi:hypothetical protein